MVVEIKDLLSRFSNLILKGEGKNEIIRIAIKEGAGVNIQSGDIKIKNNIIYLNIKPIYKNKILLKQEKILEKLKELLGDNHPKDFR